MKTRSVKSNENLKKLVLAALFTAVAYVVMLVFHVKVAFLTFDLKDAILSFGAMALGPLYGLGTVIVTAFLEFWTVSDTGWYGLIMNIISSMTFVLTASVIYRYERTLMGAIVGLASAVAATTGMMMVANILITPYFTGWARSAVAEKIPTLLLPFNFSKTMVNAGFVLILYKPLTTVLRIVGLLPPSTGEKYKFNKKSLIVLAGGLLTVIAASLIIFLYLDGSVVFGK